jgi:hypothetical protein
MALGSHLYPINYDPTIQEARRLTKMGRALEHLDDIEERWHRLSHCEEYTWNDIKKETLLEDIETLIRCSVLLINRVAELESLVKHKKYQGPKREPKVIRRPREI